MRKHNMPKTSKQTGKGTSKQTNKETSNQTGKLVRMSLRLSLIYVILALGCEGVGISNNFASIPYSAQYLTLLLFLPLGVKYIQKLLRL